MKRKTKWFCDTCGKPITTIEDGWVEWITYNDSKGKSKARDFRLVHGGGKGCQFDEKTEFKRDGGTVSDLPMRYFISTDGLIRLLSDISQGEIPTKQILEMINRLHIPGYEMARRHFDRALKKGIIEQNLPPGFFSTSDIKAVLAQKWPDDIAALRPKKPKLNLKSGFTKADLKQLLASCDDMEGHHIIWVDKFGNVHITLLPPEATPAGWDESMEDKIKFRYETLVCGNEYVGFEAARHKEYVNNLYEDLMNDWKNNRTGYIDYRE